MLQHLKLTEYRLKLPEYNFNLPEYKFMVALASLISHIYTDQRN